MNITEIESNLQKLTKSIKSESFIFEFLLSYGTPKSTIARLKQASGTNLAKVEGEILWKKKLYFKPIQKKDDFPTLDGLRTLGEQSKHEPRFIIRTDYKTLLALDQKTDDTLETPIQQLSKHLDFFLPLAGMEKAKHQNENPADVKAAEKMGRLYDELKKINTVKTKEETHNLNVFLSRLLFCFFAEDTGIFQPSQFTNAVSSHTQDVGSDLHTYLDALFLILNTEVRKTQANYLKEFPYVNGGLFRNNFLAPHFNKRSRQLLIECGELDWSAINPDIFGSMMQAVVSSEVRDGMGMHYTSVPNIMKVIEPLFLTELYEEFATSKSNTKKLMALLDRIHRIKIFDPACGSGNFLIISYKELRKLEMKIFTKLNYHGFSKISLSQFYGIELDDFAHEIAMLSLWLAEHQMNQSFLQIFKTVKPALPLTSTGNIVQGNACRLDWETVCPKDHDDEIYILGNPPYVGARFQSARQKEDISNVLKELEGKNSLDYISCWFYKASKYIRESKSEFAFVSTNSICQGQQVSFLWPFIFKDHNDIKFAYNAFYWSNNAKNKAVVAVIIVGVKSKFKLSKKIIFGEKNQEIVTNISPYLTSGSNLVVEKRQFSLSNLPPLVFGNQSVDDGNLILSDFDKSELVNKHPKASMFIRRFYGWNDLSKNIARWCLWIKEEDLKEAEEIPDIKERINNVRLFREKGGQVAKTLTSVPYRFRYVHEARKSFIAIGRNSSENRKYLPADFKSSPDIPGETIQVIYDSEPYIFSIISSNIHMLWVKAVAGGMKMDILYSVTICYNTFPFPAISNKQKQELESHVYRILEEREKHSEKTLAQLYDPDKMPDGLREAHHQNDLAIERCYRSKPFTSDEERLEYLFKLYEKMVAEEKKSNGK
jgi:type I restriction-modification system DNA methylase subunit